MQLWSEIDHALITHNSITTMKYDTMTTYDPEADAQEEARGNKWDQLSAPRYDP